MNRQLKKSPPSLRRQVDADAAVTTAEAVAAIMTTKVDADAEVVSEHIRKHIQTDLFR